jgi:hypothetical protein
MLGLGVVVIAVCPGLAHTRVKGAVSAHRGADEAGDASKPVPNIKIGTTNSSMRAMASSVAGAVANP